MYPQVLEYHDGDGNPKIEVTKRIEFFVHYWQYVFAEEKFRLDEEWLKSHRGLLQRVKLQLETNYNSRYGCRRKVQAFFVHEPFFASINPIIRSIPRGKRNAISDLRSKLSGTFNESSHADHVPAVLLLKDLQLIINYFDKYYHDKLTQSILKLLGKNSEIVSSEISDLRCLINCLIVELINKGYRTNYLSDLVFNVQSFDSFPYEKLRSDFDTDEDYEAYKKSVFSNLTIKKQIEGIVGLLKRKSREFEVIFKVQGIRWNTDPIEVIGVKFYNPNVNPLILSDGFFREDFTFNGDQDNQIPRSFCNAYVQIDGTHEPDILEKAYQRANDALQVLNGQLKKRPFIDPSKVLFAIRHRNPPELFGSFGAVSDNEPVHGLDEFQKDDINFINQLDRSNPYDAQLIRLLAEVTELRNTHSKYTLLDIYSNLEGYFGTEDNISTLFFNCLKIWAKSRYYVRIKLYLWRYSGTMKSKSGVRKMYKLSDEQRPKYGLDLEPQKVISYIKFRNNLENTKGLFDTPFWKWLIDDAIMFRDNKTAWHSLMQSRIKYLVGELNTERNLIVHSRQSEEYTRLRKQEYYNFIDITTQIFTYYHTSYSIRRPVEKVIGKIQTEADKI